MLKYREFAKPWKQGKLVLLPKSGENVPREYKPICMFSAFSKIFEYVISVRLLSNVSLRDRQFGFFEGRSYCAGPAMSKKIL